MLGSICNTRKRLTRQESKAQTRAALVTVAREHFLRYGLGGAVADKIAEDAGYSRGALYCNFPSMEDLFLAVIGQEQENHTRKFQSFFQSGCSGPEQLHQMRDAVAAMITDPDWIVLQAEFEAGALLSERIRQAFIAFHRMKIGDVSGQLCDMVNNCKVRLSLEPQEFIMVMMNLSHGLAVTQKILGSELSQESIRRLIQNLFDLLVSFE